MNDRIKITIPDNWNEIKLGKYLEIQNEIQNYSDNEEAQIAVLFWHLCGLNAIQLKYVPTETFTDIRNTLLAFMNDKQFNLQKIVTIDGVEYGFEPNLSNMAYGAYVDIIKYEKLDIDKNWAKIMSILYRPITNRNGETYTIKEYDGKINEDIWLDVSMDIHFGVFFYLQGLLKDLLSYTLKSLMDKEEVPHNIKSILAESGEAMLQSLN